MEFSQILKLKWIKHKIVMQKRWHSQNQQNQSSDELGNS